MGVLRTLPSSSRTFSKAFLCSLDLKPDAIEEYLPSMPTRTPSALFPVIIIVLPGSCSSWHQKWLTAKAIATRTKNTATAMRPCIQG